MERVLAGPLLHACRTKYLSAIAGSRKIILLGEGPGRFLCEVVRSCPGAEITCLDSSARMLAEARHALRCAKLEESRVSFVQADVLAYQFPIGVYDAAATHFLLDCFTPGQLQPLVSRIAGALTVGGIWLLSDFRLPPEGPQRWRAATILNAMYLFFRALTALPARRLTNPDTYLKHNRLSLLERHTANFGLLHTDLWRKTSQP